jgi:hypothetical protein
VPFLVQAPTVAPAGLGLPLHGVDEARGAARKNTKKRKGKLRPIVFLFDQTAQASICQSFVRLEVTWLRYTGRQTLMSLPFSSLAFVVERVAIASASVAR